MSKDHIHLFIPGPVEVSPETYEAMSHPMVGHRSGDFAALYEDVHPKLQTLFETTQPVFLSTSSAWGVMEGAIRNLAVKKVLCCCAGAFSDKWVDVAKRCGKDAEALQYEWGEAIVPADIDAKLATGEFDLVTFIHSETSTGVLNPLKEVAEVVSKYPDVLLVVDTVSSFSTVPTPVDELGVDLMLTGSQKALALPPGLAPFTCSEAAFARAESINDRGYYFDLLEFRKNQEKFMTPSTPCISTIYGLQHQLNKFFQEGVENRHARHAKTNAMVHQWAADNGFKHFPPEGFRSKALTCLKNERGLDLDAWNKLLKSRHQLMINMGYGKIKGTTFRISNMGDETEASVGNMLDALSDTLKEVA
ncbi:MAG: alanine--glyoxylate aminotransferase family protein [Verrucomicrobiota bacterium]